MFLVSNTSLPIPYNRKFLFLFCKSIFPVDVENPFIEFSKFSYLIPGIILNFLPNLKMFSAKKAKFLVAKS